MNEHDSIMLASVPNTLITILALDNYPFAASEKTFAFVREKKTKKNKKTKQNKTFWDRGITLQT